MTTMNKLIEEVNKQAEEDKLKLAKKALDSCVDVSCDSVADALKLPRWKVRLLSSGGRTKGRVTDYHESEVLNLICQC